MKFINKDDVEKTTLSNYEDCFVRMEVCLRDGRRMIIHNDDGTLKKYDEGEHQEIKEDADKVFAHYGDKCVAISLVEIEREFRWVESIDETLIIKITNPLFK